MPFPDTNTTYKVMKLAEVGKFAVPAFNCYNTDALMGAIKAAEKLRSPAIIEIFPWSLHFQGSEFVKFASMACKAATVPIALHLDHCTNHDDVFAALELPFDSIMVDASTGNDVKAGAEFVKKIVELAATKNITIEAEMGRIVGGEDGLPTVDMEAMYTEPDDAKWFVEATGVHFLAPSFGNVHGPYPPGGPLKYWQMDRLLEIGKSCGVMMVLHGTNPILPELISGVIDSGVRKVNLNKNLYVKYRKFLSENASSLEMTKLTEGGIAAFQEDAEWAIKLLKADGRV
ncbi:ketose-bisphosphate aldolase [Lipomyces arxii]|uniref:ketose-bisphosphate aldolase n=1 Tax=Lipomyces arxii TaxID=56418 RepID=UPI0034CEE725